MFLTDDEFHAETGIDIETLITYRIEDMARQMEHHQNNFDFDLAGLLYRETADLTCAADRGQEFLYMVPPTH